MIERGNWKLVHAYLKYRKEVDQLSESSLGLEETWLRHLLEWAQENSFDRVPKIRPTLPEYMLTARLDGSANALSPVYVRKIIRASYNFFQWLRTHKRGFGSINQAWLDTLKPPRMTIEHKEHEAVTLEEIRAMAKAPVYSMRDKRIRAAAAFWFLSGIRIGAFVTLPIKAVDIENLTIKQWPKFGVHTKFRKHATTYLLDIPDLLEVVKDWDRYIRDVILDSGYWFTPISPITGELDQEYSQNGNNRHSRARKDLQDWINRVGLPYHSPHKFRHGFAVYALKLAKDIGELKAISQNLMHSNISITDGIYGILSEKDMKAQINALNTNMVFTEEKDSLQELLQLTKKLIEKIETS